MVDDDPKRSFVAARLLPTEMLSRFVRMEQGGSKSQDYIIQIVHSVSGVTMVKSVCAQEEELYLSRLLGGSGFDVSILENHVKG